MRDESPPDLRRGPRPAPARATDLDAIGRVLGAVLRVGVLLSAGIILLGVVLFVQRRGIHVILLAPRGIPAGSEVDPHTVRQLLDAFTGNAHVPTAVTDIGLLTLMITPVVGVIVSLVAFARDRDWTYVGLAALVLALLAVGFALGA